jgi:curved DNA-binding protein CbpA
MKQINRAYSVLSDARKRRIYNIYCILEIELDSEFDDEEAIVELEQFLIQLTADDEQFFRKRWQKLSEPMKI